MDPELRRIGERPRPPIALYLWPGEQRTRGLLRSAKIQKHRDSELVVNGAQRARLVSVLNYGNNQMNRVLRASRFYQLICSVSVSICTPMHHFADMGQCPTHRCRSTSLPKGLSGTRIPPDITYEPPPIKTVFPEEINCPVCDPVSGIRNGRARVPDQLQPRLRAWFNNALERNGVASKNHGLTHSPYNGKATHRTATLWNFT